MSRGFSRSSSYGPWLRDLVERVHDHYVYYFDISFAETVRRHATKPKADEYGAALMHNWYEPRGVTAFKGEKVIPEHYSLEQTVKTILADAGL